MHHNSSVQLQPYDDLVAGIVDGKLAWVDSSCRVQLAEAQLAIRRRLEDGERVRGDLGRVAGIEVVNHEARVVAVRGDDEPVVGRDGDFRTSRHRWFRVVSVRADGRANLGQAQSTSGIVGGLERGDCALELGDEEEVQRRNAIPGRHGGPEDAVARAGASRDGSVSDFREQVVRLVDGEDADEVSAEVGRDDVLVERVADDFVDVRGGLGWVGARFGQGEVQRLAVGELVAAGDVVRGDGAARVVGKRDATMWLGAIVRAGDGTNRGVDALVPGQVATSAHVEEVDRTNTGSRIALI